MSREKSTYKRVISSIHKKKIVKLESEIIMKSFCNKPLSFASTSTKQNTQLHIENFVHNDNTILNQSTSKESLSNQNSRTLQNSDNNMEIDTASNCTTLNN